MHTDIVPELDHRCNDAKVHALTAELRRRHGDALRAVVLYGSYLRGRAAEDTLLDFYALVDDYRKAAIPRWQAWLARALPPNVYYARTEHAGQMLRAKYALLALDQFERGVSMRWMDCYLWARFAQPCAVVYCSDANVRARIEDALATARRTMLTRALVLVRAHTDAAELWQRALAQTFSCELRAERPERIGSLQQAWADYYERVTADIAAQPGSGLIAEGDGRYRVILGRRDRARARMAWRLRGWQGKLLTMLRVAKAALTFDDGLDYLLWKIERHSGISVTPSARQRRHPLIFGWPLLWRLYRAGAFR